MFRAGNLDAVRERVESADTEPEQWCPHEPTTKQAEFLKLEKGAGRGTRLLKVLWDSRTRNGVRVNTGAYVIRTTVTLLRIPGIAEDNTVRTDYRRVGVLRSL